MQSIERIPLSNDWMTLILLSLLIVLFFLSFLDAVRFQEVISKLAKLRFLGTQQDDEDPFFTSFQWLFSLFSILVFSLFFFEVKVNYFESNPRNFFDFFTVFSYILLYFLLKKFFEKAMVAALMLQNELLHFMVSKTNYFFSISVYLFALLIGKEYANLNPVFCFYLAGILCVIGFIFHVVDNKKLIINHLFYFILYICAFEIAPLLILFKWMF